MNYYDIDGNRISVEEFLRLRNADEKNWVIGKTECVHGSVSTVLLGLDHNHSGGTPIIFETLAYDSRSGKEEICARYTFKEEARRGHWEIVEELGGIKSGYCAECEDPFSGAADYICPKCRSSLYV